MTQRINKVSLALIIFSLLLSCDSNKKDKEKEIKREADFSMYYKNGTLFCTQKGVITIKGKDTSLNRLGEIKTYFPNGVEWVTVSSLNNYTDSMTIHRENGELEKTVTMIEDTTRTTIYEHGQISLVSSMLGTANEEWFYKSPVLKQIILSGSSPSFLVLHDSTGSELIKCEYNTRTRLFEKTNSVYLDEPEYPEMDVPYEGENDQY